jgi:hypothetical protein
MLSQLLHELLIQWKRGNKAIFRVVTSANCPETNLHVYISDDVAQACAHDPSAKGRNSIESIVIAIQLADPQQD